MPEPVVPLLRLTAHEDGTVTVGYGDPDAPLPDDPYTGDIGPDDSYAGVQFAVWALYAGQVVALSDVKAEAIARRAVVWHEVADAEAEAHEQRLRGRRHPLECPRCGGTFRKGWAELAGGHGFIRARVVVAIEDPEVEPRIIRDGLVAYQCIDCNAVLIP
jgi:hypothetical protein